MTINTDPLHKFSYNQIPNHNFTFALLQEDRYLHTPFMCKDYLQDIFWAAEVGKPIYAHGLNWEAAYLPPAPTYRLALHGGRVDLAPNVPYLQEFLNRFESAQGFPLSTVTTTEDAKLIVVEFATAWTTCGPLVSAFTTLIRLAGGYTGGDPVTYLESINKPLLDSRGTQIWNPEPKYMQIEIARLAGTLPKLKGLLAGKKVIHRWVPGQAGYTVHNFGIIGAHDFPTG